jgi:7-cyano-7-deazaguanine synthase in queuosine biosynthesis
VKVRDHVKTTAARYGTITGLLAALPDLGVAAQRVPAGPVRRAGARFHHSELATIKAMLVSPRVGLAWQAHYDQDDATHPAGTYGVAEASRIPPAGRVLAYSGGPDSFIAWRLLGQPPAMYLDVGNISAGRELMLARDAMHKFGGQLTVYDAPWLTELPSGWIPYRNLHIILAAASIGPEIILARIAEWGPDKNPSFFRRTERLLAASRGGHFQAATHLPAVRIWTPFGHLTKTQLVARYLAETGRDQGIHDLTTWTRSCYDGNEMFCGRCGACWCRWVAFENNGITVERDRYEVRPTRAEYYRRLHWRDFRPAMVPMYVKRAAEMRGHDQPDTTGE